MQSKNVVYSDGDEYDVVITVHTATVLDGMRRAILDIEASTEELNLVEEKYAGYLRFMVSEVYPSCLAATVTIENGENAKKKLSKDMSFNDFAKLPDALFKQWQKAVYELNPHWVYKSSTAKEGEEQEPTNGNSES